jgi:hypothetical protein
VANYRLALAPAMRAQAGHHRLPRKAWNLRRAGQDD